MPPMGSPGGRAAGKEDVSSFGEFLSLTFQSQDQINGWSIVQYLLSMKYSLDMKDLLTIQFWTIYWQPTLGLRICAGLSLVAANGGYSLVVVNGDYSLAAE